MYYIVQYRGKAKVYKTIAGARKKLRALKERGIECLIIQMEGELK